MRAQGVMTSGTIGWSSFNAGFGERRRTLNAEISLCRLESGGVSRRPLTYLPGETVDELVERVLRLKKDYYGPGCYVPLGVSMPNFGCWLEVRAYSDEELQRKGR